MLPSVTARGGSLRVANVTGGVVTLKASGSPGAALPLAFRAEAMIRAAVPEVTRVRVIGPGGEPPPTGGGDLADRAGVCQPAIRILPAGTGEEALAAAAAEAGFPCVAKAVSLSRSQEASTAC